MKLSVVKKIDFKGMRVAILTRSSTDDNNHNAILYVNDSSMLFIRAGADLF